MASAVAGVGGPILRARRAALGTASPALVVGLELNPYLARRALTAHPLTGCVSPKFLEHGGPILLLATGFFAPARILLSTSNYLRKLALG